jgi:predicted nucleic acid-binding Zn ribbon protein
VSIIHGGGGGKIPPSLFNSLLDHHSNIKGAVRVKAQELIDKLENELAKPEPDLTSLTDSLNSLKEMIGSCKECESDFFKIRYDQVFCSEKCSNRYRQRVFRERKSEILKNQGVSCQK